MWLVCIARKLDIIINIKGKKELKHLSIKLGDAPSQGYATVCFADFALPEGFNPKIKLVRDKTLMQGHDCCNHRYEWSG